MKISFYLVHFDNPIHAVRLRRVVLNFLAIKRPLPIFSLSLEKNFSLSLANWQSKDPFPKDPFPAASCYLVVKNLWLEMHVQYPIIVAWTLNLTCNRLACWILEQNRFFSIWNDSWWSQVFHYCMYSWLDALHSVETWNKHFLFQMHVLPQRKMGIRTTRLDTNIVNLI